MSIFTVSCLSYPAKRKYICLCALLLDLDSSEPLRFAYSCTYLILARRTLKHMSLLQAECLVNSKSSNMEESRFKFIQCAADHSHNILNLFLSMSDLTTYVHPVYENLLCSFAMVTLVELANHIPNIFDTVTLMEQAISHIQPGGTAESVGRWSLGVMKQCITEENEMDSISQGTSNISREPFDSSSKLQRPQEKASWNLEREFPSLQEIFFESLS